MPPPIMATGFLVISSGKTDSFFRIAGERRVPRRVGLIL